MTTQIFDALLQQGILVAILGAIGWTLWKRYDNKQKETSEELKQLRSRFENELVNGNSEMRIIIKENTDVIKQVISTQNRTNNLLESLLPEVLDFKKSNIYKSYLNEKTINNPSR